MLVTRLVQLSSLQLAHSPPHFVGKVTSLNDYKDLAFASCPDVPQQRVLITFSPSFYT